MLVVRPSEGSRDCFHTSQAGTDVFEALDRKRKELDKQIADFKARKEEEYSTFERELRNGSQENAQDTRIDTTRLQGADGGYGLRKRPSNISVQRANALANSEGTDPIHDVGTLGGARLIGSSPPDSRTTRSPGSITPSHERDLAFRGVFTPNYLPLLESKHEQSEITFVKDRPGASPARTPSPVSRVSTTTSLSSSINLPSSTLQTSDYPPLSRPISSSLPRQKPAHGRRSSSKSDISIEGLRSSLRNAKTPRSPKRVLFSIDNTVVSPSTSPVAQRSSRITRKREQSRNISPDDRGQMWSPEQHSSELLELSPTAIDGRDSSWISSILATSRGAASLSNGNFPLNGTDYLENIHEHDALFSFDEEIDLKEGEDDDDEFHDDLESDDHDGRAETMPMSSPHAGSLPIEIRWPPRQTLSAGESVYDP